MFWKPNQTGQRKQKERSLARKRHPQTAAREPSNSNRETKSLTPIAAVISNRKAKLLETLQLQQNKFGKREENANPYPSVLLRLKGGPIVYFHKLTDDFNRTLLRSNQAGGGKDLRSAGVHGQTGWLVNRHPDGRTPKAKAGGRRTRRPYA